MTDIQYNAKLIDNLLAELEQAVSDYSDACLAVNKKHRQEQANRERWPHQQVTAQSHPVYGQPLKHVRTAVASHPTLRQALRFRVTTRASVADHHKGGE